MKKILILTIISNMLFSQEFRNNRKDLVEINYKKKLKETKEQVEKKAIEKIRNFTLKEMRANYPQKNLSLSDINTRVYYEEWDSDNYNVVCRIKVKGIKIKNPKISIDGDILVRKNKFLPDNKPKKKVVSEKIIIPPTIEDVPNKYKKQIEELEEIAKKITKRRGMTDSTYIDEKERIDFYKNNIIKYFGGDIHSIYLRALILFNSKEYKRSEKEFLKVIKKDSVYNAGVYFYGGLSLYKNKKQKSSIDFFDMAIIMDSTFNSEMYYYNGLAYYKTKQYDMALENLYNNLGGYMNDYESYYLIGIILEKQKKESIAINEYSQAIRINKEFKNAYINRGILFSKMGFFEKASRDADKACELGSCKLKNTLVELKLYKE